ncbi:5990_t:CDS:1, partial [Racocetra persica]
GSQSIGDISIPLTEPMEKLNIQDNSQQETSLQAQIQIPPK